MIGAILFLAILVFGMQILFGAGKVENYYKFLVWLIVAPILLAIGCNHALWFWYSLPFWMQVVGVFLIPFLALALLRQIFPKVSWLKSLPALVLELLIYLVSFPFRVLFRATKFTVGRERHRTKLNPYRAVVGSRPPVNREREIESKRSNLFD
ncbi:hypothetical protein BH20ACI2_BH20ACI2_02120 [soil metagenome]